MIMPGNRGLLSESIHRAIGAGFASEIVVFFEARQVPSLQLDRMFQKKSRRSECLEVEWDKPREDHSAYGLRL